MLLLHISRNERNAHTVVHRHHHYSDLTRCLIAPNKSAKLFTKKFIGFINGCDLVSYLKHTHITSVLSMRLLLLLSLLGVAQAKLRGSLQAEAEDDLVPARALAQSCANNGGCMNGSTCK
jgi:hypothetical protein